MSKHIKNKHKKYAQHILIMITSSYSFAYRKYITLDDLVLKEANTQFFAWESTGQDCTLLQQWAKQLYDRMK